MAELLDANQRYHLLLAQSDAQNDALKTATAEVHRLQTELRALELLESRARAQKDHADSLVDAMRAEAATLEARARDAEERESDLSRQLSHSTAQLNRLREQLGVEARRNETADRRAEDAYERGIGEGVAREKARHAFSLRRVEAKAQKAASDAYEFGRAQRASEQELALLREQAQQRLALHNQEQERLRRVSAERNLVAQRRERDAATRRGASLTERLGAQRYRSSNLAAELASTQKAYAIDLERADETEAALDATCAQCSALMASGACASCDAAAHATAQATVQAATAAASPAQPRGSAAAAAAGAFAVAGAVERAASPPGAGGVEVSGVGVDVGGELLKLRAQLEANRARISALASRVPSSKFQY